MFDAQSMQSEVSRSYNSFSGSDIRAMIGPYQFAEIQAISYSITREKAPIYTMGSPDVRSFSRNKRGVGGSLVWINFDRHALLNVFANVQGKFIANKDDIRPSYRLTGTGGANMPDTAIFQASAVRGSSGLDIAATIDQFNTPLTAVSGFKEAALAWYTDQLPGFDVTLVGVNELGAAAAMKIQGVELLSEGSGVSIDDAVTEMQASFVARLVEPWTAVQTPFSGMQLA